MIIFIPKRRLNNAKAISRWTSGLNFNDKRASQGAKNYRKKDAKSPFFEGLQQLRRIYPLSKSNKLFHVQLEYTNFKRSNDRMARIFSVRKHLVYVVEISQAKLMDIIHCEQ
mmetsp:Transcript_23862/g.36897  ORF Transcript_23862/g.36897 Transcript_23862/m.36897 type:complete len:112 (+) Transcript_23862:382-717(+)